MKVGDIKKIEPNIHAGTKYLRKLMDEHYADKDIDPFNRLLFSFAAYNAGPTRMRRLRGRAAEQGLDPNKWFNNVELMAARHVSREPVEYVSNIYKYYIAYRMAEAQRAR